MEQFLLRNGTEVFTRVLLDDRRDSRRNPDKAMQNMGLSVSHQETLTLRLSFIEFIAWEAVKYFTMTSPLGPILVS